VLFSTCRKKFLALYFLSGVKPKPIIAVHGGAGRARRMSEEERREVENALIGSLKAGLEVLRGGNALDAVEEAVKSLEATGLFNAGKGAVLNLRGEVELDAGIMWGKTLSAGAVASLKRTWNAISLARVVMEKTDHVLIVGEGADLLAEKFGFERHPGPTRRVLERYSECRKLVGETRYELWRRNYEVSNLFVNDTVGAVALDQEGNLAAAASTGGLFLKLPGRVGDSPIPGAGFYAENGVAAVSATGVGEVMLKLSLASRVALLIRGGYSLERALSEAVSLATNLFGANTVGVIAVDAQGNYAEKTNAEVFYRGWASPSGSVLRPASR
jgi:beta-aspartyl-peptidase (threonine type)